MIYISHYLHQTVKWLAGILFFTVVFTFDSSAQTSWKIEPREVLVPVAASDELKDSIIQGGQPNVSGRKSLVPVTLSEWKKTIASRKKNKRFNTSALIDKFNVKMNEDEINGVPIFVITPLNESPRFNDRVMLYLHGGAYVFNAGEQGVLEGVVIAGSTGVPVIVVDYRMPPESPFPAALDDVVAVYTHLLKNKSSQKIAIGGTSAGGGLALATVQKLKKSKLPLPALIYAGTPWSDLSKTGDTLSTNEGIDRVLVTYDGFLSGAAKLYAGGYEIKHPGISPVYGDFTDFPPTYLVTGTRDMLLSDTVRIHRKLREAGVEADLNVYEGLSHAGYLVALSSPESRQVYLEMTGFMRRHFVNSEAHQQKGYENE